MRSTRVGIQSFLRITKVLNPSIVSPDVLCDWFLKIGGSILETSPLVIKPGKRRSISLRNEIERDRQQVVQNALRSLGVHRGESSNMIIRLRTRQQAGPPFGKRESRKNSIMHLN